MNPAGTATVPENEIESLPPLAKFNLIDAFEIVSGSTSAAMMDCPVGVLVTSAGLVPTAVSNASENPSPSLSGPLPTTAAAAVTVTSTDALTGALIPSLTLTLAVYVPGAAYA